MARAEGLREYSFQHPRRDDGVWGATEQNAELRILFQIRSAIKSGVLHFLVLAAQ